MEEEPKFELLPATIPAWASTVRLLSIYVAQVALLVALVYVLASFFGFWRDDLFIHLAIFAFLISAVGFFLFDFFRTKKARLRHLVANISRFSILIVASLAVSYVFAGCKWETSSLISSLIFTPMLVGFGLFLFGLVSKRKVPSSDRAPGAAMRHAVFWTVCIVLWSIFILTPIFLRNTGLNLWGFFLWFMPTLMCSYFLVSNLRVVAASESSSKTIAPATRDT